MDQKIFGSNHQFLFSADELRIYHIPPNFSGPYNLAGDLARHTIPAGSGCLNKVVLNMSATCNLRCVYCYADFGLYSHQETGLLQTHALHKIVNSLISDEISMIEVVELFGGEPLSNKRLLSTTLELFNQNFEVSNFLLTTNGTFMDAKTAKILSEYDVWVCVSINGPRFINDKLRGEGTYDKAIHSIQLLRDAGNVNVGVVATITGFHHQEGISGNDVIEHFHDLELPVRVMNVATKETEISTGEIFDSTLFQQQIEYEFDKIEAGNSSLSLISEINEIISALAFREGSMEFCDDLNRGYSRTFDVDGSEYNCFHFWGDQKLQLSSDKMLLPLVVKYNSKNGRNCEFCWARNICKSCPALIMSGDLDLPYSDGACRKEQRFSMVLEELGKRIENQAINSILANFGNNYFDLGKRLGWIYPEAKA